NHAHQRRNQLVSNGYGIAIDIHEVECNIRSDSSDNIAMRFVDCARGFQLCDAWRFIALEEIGIGSLKRQQAVSPGYAQIKSSCKDAGRWLIVNAGFGWWGKMLNNLAVTDCEINPPAESIDVTHGSLQYSSVLSRTWLRGIEFPCILD